MTPLSGPLSDTLDSLAVRESYRPHHVIHAAGHTESRFWFVEKGFARKYYLEASGKEHTLSFYQENAIIWSNQGHWHEVADHYIEVLEPSVMLAVTYRAFEQLSGTFSEIGQLTQELIRRQYHDDTGRNRLLDLTAEERYRYVRKTMPELFRRTPLRLIASYLNMTRENLSRLMSREDRRRR